LTGAGEAPLGWSENPLKEARVTIQPTVEPVKNGWHALSRDMNLAVFGATAEDARRRFNEAVAKDEELRSRPEPGWGKTPAEVG